VSSEGFSSRDLAALELPGAPSSHQGWEKHAKVNGWEVREHRGRGRGGKTIEFIPPAPLADLIRRHVSGETLTVEEVRRVLGVNRRVARKAKGDAERPVTRASSAARRYAAGELADARFSAWLMSRVMARATQTSAMDEQQLLDCHELAMRVLMLLTDHDRVTLASIASRPEVADRAIDFVIEARRSTSPTSGDSRT
jgi:hypothetical protein